MKKKLSLVLLLVFSCNSVMKYKNPNHNGNNLIGKRLLIIPANLTYYDSRMFQDIETTKVEDEFLYYNQTILNKLKDRLEFYKLEVIYDNFDIEKSKSFNEIWDALEKNQNEEKLKRVEISEISKNKKKAIELLSKVQNSNISSYGEDYILSYKIKYYQNTVEKKNSIQISFVLLLILAISSGSPSGGNVTMPPSSGIGSLQYLLIEKKTNEIVLIDEIEGLYLDDDERTNSTLSKFIKQLIEYDI